MYGMAGNKKPCIISKDKNNIRKLLSLKSSTMFVYVEIAYGRDKSQREILCCYSTGLWWVVNNVICEEGKGQV